MIKENDLRTIPWWYVNVGPAAAQAAYEAVGSGKLTMGGICRSFEERIASILDVPHVVSTSSGTAALTLALLEAGVGPGTEVIIPDQTWIATGHAPMLLGADVVLADVEKDKRVLDPQAFARAITPRTRAVIPVHLNGKAADMPAIRALAASHDIVVIEDAAQAFTSRSSEGWLGTNSHCGCFSLSVGKFVTSGQGGYVVTCDDERARRLRLARIHGTTDIYAPNWEIKGGNFRFWDLPAAIALTQLDMMESKRGSLKELYLHYRSELKNLERLRVVEFDLEAGELPLYVECMSEERDSLISFLSLKGIQCRTQYAPLHNVPHFVPTVGGFGAMTEKSAFEERYPNSLHFGRECFVLPCGPDRQAWEIETTIKAIREWHTTVR